ncbi:MAG: DNA modification methylase [Boseongicola sp.]|nr:DNA modification methylase [Boseongicola sp.]
MSAQIINVGDKVEMVAVGDLACHPENPRRGNLDEIRSSIRANGFYGALVVQRSTGHILAGNHRFMAAEAEGLDKVPVIYVDADDEDAKAILVGDNRLSDLAENDPELLAALLQAIQSRDVGLTGTGYSDDDLAQMLAQAAEDMSGELEGEDEIPETPEQPVTRPGDLWVLGNHRLLAGDATVATDVERLLGSVKPLLMVTDPPYGVEYDPAWRNKAGAAATKRTGKVLNDDRADWYDAWVLFPGDVAYVWHGALHATTVADSLERANFNVRSQIIWAKDRLVLSRGDYHWQHEPCWYAVKKTGKGHWAGDRKQTTLWQISSRDQDAETVHGTQKPVECMRRPILNNSSPGQAVFEPFMGSGTTLIAAESTGRVCYGVELNPAYVDVAIMRWQKVTGQEAVLDGDGRSFDEIKEGRLDA